MKFSQLNQDCRLCFELAKTGTKGSHKILKSFSPLIFGMMT